MTAISLPKPVIRTPFVEDVPHAFQYEFPYRKLHLYGPYANTIWSFAHYHHFELELDVMEQYRTLQIEEKIRIGHYNLSWHGDTYSKNTSGLQFSYPLEFTKACILVPLEDELPKFYYVIWPFGPYIWLTLLVAIVYIAILLRFLDDSAGRSDRSISRLALILSSSNSNVKLQNRPIRVMVFYMLLFVLEFILSIFHQTHMTSYCIKHPFPAPRNTIEEIQKSNMDIYLPINVFEELQEPIHNQLHALESKIVSSQELEIVSKLTSLNRSAAYIFFDDMGEFMLKQQQHLTKPYFHLTPVCVCGGFETFPLYPQTNLGDLLKAHILAVHQAGLWDFWEREAFDVAVYANKAQLLRDNKHLQSVDLEALTVGWIVLSVGLILSCCTMALELVLGNIRKIKLSP